MAKKEYTLKTIEDISKVVTEKNYKCLMLDIADCFKNYLMIKKEHPEMKFKFILWKDDKTVGMKGIKFINKKGKTVREVKLKRRKK